jgi:hypothetical protein
VDRLGRSLQDLLGVLGELHAKGCELYLHQQGIDTRTPAGKALFQMMGVFAEFERAIMVERVKSGLKRAKAQGKRLGRPRKDDPALVADIKRLGGEAGPRLGRTSARPRREPVLVAGVAVRPPWARRQLQVLERGAGAARAAALHAASLEPPALLMKAGVPEPSVMPIRSRMDAPR